MLELNRQLVIFGNFNSINFENIGNLEHLRTMYNLVLNAMPDIVMPSDPIPPISVSATPPEIRPVFQTIDKSITIFLGKERIHVEQFNKESETYQEFFELSLEILKEIVKVFDLKVTRVAMNGQLFDDDESLMKRSFQKAFKTSELYGTDSNEWQYRIVDVTHCPEIGCSINKIISFTRGIFWNNLRKSQSGLMTVYDYNTVPNEAHIYEFNQIEQFYKKAYDYRLHFIEISFK